MAGGRLPRGRQYQFSLLNWWFTNEHLLSGADGGTKPFQYYIAQREAVETIIYLYDAIRVKDKCDLLRFDSSDALSAGMFDEEWRRFVIKMATRSGKTKAMRLILAWCYYHRGFIGITRTLKILFRQPSRTTKLRTENFPRRRNGRLYLRILQPVKSAIPQCSIPARSPTSGA